MISMTPCLFDCGTGVTKFTFRARLMSRVTSFIEMFAHVHSYLRILNVDLIFINFLLLLLLFTNLFAKLSTKFFNYL